MTQLGDALLERVLVVEPPFDHFVNGLVGGQHDGLLNGAGKISLFDDRMVCCQMGFVFH